MTTTTENRIHADYFRVITGLCDGEIAVSASYGVVLEWDDVKIRILPERLIDAAEAVLAAAVAYRLPSSVMKAAKQYGKVVR